MEDVVDAVVTVWKNGTTGEIYNISSDYELSVMEVTKMIIGIVKPGEPIEDWIEYVDDRPFNDARYHIVSEKLRKLGWKPIKQIKDLLEFIH